MAFQGLKITTENKNPARSLNGFYGFNITVDVVPVKVTDYRGKGLANVTVIAENPTSGSSFTGVTNSTGNVFMSMDANTPVTVIKDLVVVTDQYSGESSPTFTIDLPYLQQL